MAVVYKAYKLRGAGEAERWDTLNPNPKYILEEPDFDDKIAGRWYLENSFASMEEAVGKVEEFCKEHYLHGDFVILPTLEI